MKKSSEKSVTAQLMSKRLTIEKGVDRDVKDRSKKYEQNSLYEIMLVGRPVSNQIWLWKEEMYKDCL